MVGLSLVNSGDRSSLVEGPFREVVAIPPMDDGAGEVERPVVLAPVVEALAAVEEEVVVVDELV